MDLLRLWKDSLQVFKPENFKLFGLVTLNAYRQFWQVILRNWLLMFGIFFIIVLATGICEALFYDPMSHTLLTPPMVQIFYSTTTINFLMLIFVLATRASMKRKTARYFLEYFKRFWYWILIYSCTDLSIYILFSYFSQFAVLSFFLLGLFFIAKIIFLLFILDAARSYKMMSNALRNTGFFIVANAPICLLLFVLFELEYWLFEYVVYVIPMKIYWVIATINYFLVSTLLIVILTNLYIKHTHDNSKDYFPQPS